jgi:hypothetical protein
MPRASAASLSFPGVAGTPDRLKPPSDLGPAERAVFIDIIANNRPEHFKPSDSVLLCAYARACVLEARSALELGGGDPKALPRWNGAVKAMLGLAMRLRLSPQSRQPNLPSRPGAKPPRELSVYERMALQEGDHDGSA